MAGIIDRISFTKGGATSGREYMLLNIEDDDGKVIYAGEMTMEGFAKMVTGQGNIVIERITDKYKQPKDK